ncbi:DUF1631 domain-containing protein [Pseudothauera nasutitermitis]|uniref:DUF1631 domain-containing protein n=1 Tax=Pseudothauera nasutitermitis TaxID=2565930 RepID=A0A4S4AT59_9RHOO|nr:DUF1631 family protein [Pseudothauera nasutitermitis]THF63073.1 DUF1631 domain-containing protein [Pseudothauera nasutitermitis]
MNDPTRAAQDLPLQPRLREQCRTALLARLEQFARAMGFDHGDWLQRFLHAAGQAHDELAGLHDRRGFERAHGLTASRISLVHENDLEFTLELTALARRLRERCGAELVRLHQRYMTLLEQRDAAAEQTPVGPEAVCSALRALSDAAGFDAAQRLRFLERCAEPLGHTLHALYRELNETMSTAGISPRQTERPRPPAGNASPAPFNTPAPARPAPPPTAPPPAPVAPPTSAPAAPDLPPAQAAAQSVDRLFDALPQCTEISPQLAAALALLREPFRQCILADHVQGTRKARALLERLITLGATLGPQCPATHPAALTLQALAGRALQQPEHLEEILCEADALAEERRTAAFALGPPAVELAERAERREHSLIQATHLINRLSSTDTPDAIRTFLTRSWLPLLARLHYHHGDGHAQWRSAAELADRLLRSAHPPQDPHGRSRWLNGLPALVRDLNQGLSALGLDEAARQAAMAPCMSLHSALIAGQRPAAQPQPAPDPARLSAPLGPNGLRLFSHGGYAATAIGHHPAATAGPGSWLVVDLPEGEPMRGCLVWSGATQRLVMLANPDSSRVLVATRRALAELAKNDACRLLDARTLLAQPAA